MIARATWISEVDVRAAFHRLRVNLGDESKQPSEPGLVQMNCT